MNISKSASWIAALAILPLAANTALAEDPPLEEAQTETKADGAVLETRVFFEFDKAELNAKGKAELDKAAAWLKANPDAKLVIEGHTDKVGDLAYNRNLSDRRADSTRTYLISVGVNPDRIVLVPYGETLPVVPTEERERANRRIHLYSVHNKPIVKTNTKIVTVKETVPVKTTVTEYVPVEKTVIKPTPLRFGLSAGGGVVQSLDGETRDITDIGGLWNVRLTAGTRSLIGAEVAYIGSAQDIDNEMGLGDSAALLGNGAEGALRIGLPNSDLQPYVFAGAGMIHYDVIETNVDIDDDNVVFFPAGLGLAYRTNNMMFDLRGTARASYDDEVFDQMAGKTNLDNWSASAQLGVEF